MKVCLDTNAYSSLMRGNGALSEFLGKCEQVVVPAAVVEELTHGFLKGSRFSANQELLDRFLAQPTVRFAEADVNVATRFGFLATALEKKGRPIPINDVWIAATALETGARVVSYDRHFDEIEGIIRIDP